MGIFDKTEDKTQLSRASANQGSVSESQSFSMSPPPLQFKPDEGENEAEETGVIAWIKKNPGTTAIGVTAVAAALGWYFFSGAGTTAATTAATPAEALKEASTAAIESAPRSAIEVILDKVLDDGVDAAMGNSIGSLARGTAASIREGMDASDATWANLPIFDAKGSGFD